MDRPCEGSPPQSRPFLEHSCPPELVSGSCSTPARPGCLRSTEALVSIHTLSSLRPPPVALSPQG